MKETNHHIHTIEPFYRFDSNILILGSFPSVKSRETGFFYGHKQNRFWKICAAIFGKSVPESIDEKKTLLAECKIALWDVIAECEISGSSDASITGVIPNDIGFILTRTEIKHIFTNGKTADGYYDKYINTEIPKTCLPSTSPANAAFGLDELVRRWSIIRNFVP